MISLEGMFFLKEEKLDIAPTQVSISRLQPLSEGSILQSKFCIINQNDKIKLQCTECSDTHTKATETINTALSLREKGLFFRQEDSIKPLY